MWNLTQDVLPDKEGVYIVCGTVVVSPGDEPKPFVDAAEYLSWRSFPWLCVSDMENVYQYDVVAWMPLPEPCVQV